MAQPVLFMGRPRQTPPRCMPDMLCNTAAVLPCQALTADFTVAAAAAAAGPQPCLQFSIPFLHAKIYFVARRASWSHPRLQTRTCSSSLWAHHGLLAAAI